jgi:hypothetical protein
VFGTSDVATGSGSTGVRNTIIAQNANGDCSNGGGASQFSTSVDSGNNLDGGDGSCFRGGAASDKVAVANPLLGQPADNGGPVLTDRLEIGSPAIDGGTDVDCPATDARGVPRPQGASCDIGAYEFAPASLSLANSAPATAATGVPFDETITVSQPGTMTNTASATDDEGANVSGSATTNVLAPVAPTGATAPTATTDTATGIGQTAATLNGQVAPGGQPTAYFFEYETSSSYGDITPILHTAASPQNVSAAIAGLKAGTKYHYRLVAVNDSGSSFGGDWTFTTARARLELASVKLAVKQGKVRVPFTCASSTACSGSFSITARVSPGKTVRCTVPGKSTTGVVNRAVTLR